MGSNKRYEQYYDKRMRMRLAEHAIRPQPISLTDAELDLEHNPVTDNQRPVPVRAWARYPESVIQVEGIAVAWTSRAVMIEWETADGDKRTAWVWASAVDRI